MNIEKAIVNSTTSNLFWRRLFATVVTATLLLTLVQIFVSHAGAQTTQVARAKTFATPQDAANSLIDAAEKYDEAALTEVLGPDSYDIIHTGEPARDREKCKDSRDYGYRRRGLAVSCANRQSWSWLVLRYEGRPAGNYASADRTERVGRD
jgi:hypothetical protein